MWNSVLCENTPGEKNFTISEFYSTILKSYQRPRTRFHPFLFFNHFFYWTKVFNFKMNSIYLVFYYPEISDPGIIIEILVRILRFDTCLLIFHYFRKKQWRYTWSKKYFDEYVMDTKITLRKHHATRKYESNKLRKE